MAKIEEIILYETKSERCSRTLVAKIDRKQNLVLEGYDIGESVREWWGDSDYEFWLTVAAEYKDTILLWLIKERFTTDVEFKEWLKDKDVPVEFDRWV